MTSARLRDDAGSLALPMLVLVWVSIVLAVALVDVGAYLLAASRAQGAADAAALAAVAADLAEPAPPGIVARSVAGRNGARVESCVCRAGDPRVEVTVSVPVGGLFIARRVGAQRVTASAQAQLVEEASPPGPGDDRTDEGPAVDRTDEGPAVWSRPAPGEP